MVELDPEVKLKELEEEPHIVRWLEKRYCFSAELVNSGVWIWVYDGISYQEFENCWYPYEVAEEKWLSWFRILSSH